MLFYSKLPNNNHNILVSSSCFSKIMHHQVFQQLQSILLDHLHQNNPRSPFNCSPLPSKTQSCANFTNKTSIQYDTLNYSQKEYPKKRVRSLPKIMALDIAHICDKYNWNKKRSQIQQRKRDVDSLYQFNRQSLKHCISNNEVHSHPQFYGDYSLGSEKRRRSSGINRINESCVFCGCSPCDQRLVCAHASHLSCFLKSPKIPKCEKCQSKNNYNKE